MPSPRQSLVADLLTFHTRLWLGGFVIAALVPLSAFAACVNFVSGKGPEEGMYGRIHGAAQRIDRRIKSLGTRAGQSLDPSLGSSEVPRSVRESAVDRSSRMSA